MKINQIKIPRTTINIKNIVEQVRTYPVKTIIKFVRQSKQLPALYEDAISGKIKYLADYMDEAASVVNHEIDIKEQFLNDNSLTGKAIELFFDSNKKNVKKIEVNKVSGIIEIRGYDNNNNRQLKQDPRESYFDKNSTFLAALNNTKNNHITLFWD